MAALPGLRVESTETMAIHAGERKAQEHLSVADAWIAALATERNAMLVHKDPEFEQVAGIVHALKRPYKGGA